MVVRSLLTVLTLLGVVPLRICTCGAAHIHYHAPAPAPSSDPPPSTPAIGEDSGPVHHHHDCGIHKPRPAMSQGVSFVLAEVPTDDAAAILGGMPEPVAAPAPAAVEPRSPDPP